MYEPPPPLMRRRYRWLWGTTAVSIGCLLFWSVVVVREPRIFVQNDGAGLALILIGYSLLVVARLGSAGWRHRDVPIQTGCGPLSILYWLATMGIVVITALRILWVEL